MTPEEQARNAFACEILPDVFVTVNQHFTEDSTVIAVCFQRYSMIVLSNEALHQEKNIPEAMLIAIEQATKRLRDDIRKIVL